MTFAQAQSFKMPFGKHNGRTLDQIAETDDGLRYLDWLRGFRDLEGHSKSRQCGWNIDAALEVYLTDPRTTKDLARLLEDDA